MAVRRHRNPVCKYCGGAHESGMHRYSDPNWEAPMVITSRREFEPKNNAQRAKAKAEAMRHIERYPRDREVVIRAVLHFYGEPFPLEPIEL